MGPSGGFVVTWTSNEQDGSGQNVYARLYNAEGEVQGDEFLVNTTATGGQQASSVAMNAAGDFVIVWHGTGVGGPAGVFAQRYLVRQEGVGDEFNPDGCHDHGCACEGCTSALNAVLTGSDNGLNDSNDNEAVADESTPSDTSDVVFAEEDWSEDATDSPDLSGGNDSESSFENGEESGDSGSEALPEEQPV